MRTQVAWGLLTTLQRPVCRSGSILTRLPLDSRTRIRHRNPNANERTRTKLIRDLLPEFSSMEHKLFPEIVVRIHNTCYATEALRPLLLQFAQDEDIHHLCYGIFQLYRKDM